jgi:hypothetical protein
LAIKPRQKPLQERQGEGYRAARRNAAKRQKLVWRALERRRLANRSHNRHFADVTCPRDEIFMT